MKRKAKLYRGWFGSKARRRCPHTRLEGVYGDRINQVGGWRLYCFGCRRFLDGPVKIARVREPEWVEFGEE